MKQFILYLFILLPFCVNSQVNETFDGPMLGADWIGKDRGQFVVNADGRLQLNIKPTESGTASIGKEIAYSPDMQWEFDVYMQNQPSDENKLCIYLYQENQERYYYVRLGNTGNKELGLKRNGNGNLILPQTDFEESPLLLHVKVTLEDNLRWSLYYKTDDMEGYRLEGSAMYTIKNNRENQKVRQSCLRSSRYRPPTCCSLLISRLILIRLSSVFRILETLTSKGM